VRLRIAIATAVFCSIASLLYVLDGAEPGPGIAWFLRAGPVLAVILWLCKDARERQIGAVHDLGFFLLLFWPFVIPWYAFRSRGRGGWKLLLGLVVVIGAAPLTWAVVSALRH
jgi:di/tricarboxylate transporter